MTTLTCEYIRDELDRIDGLIRLEMKHGWSGAPANQVSDTVAERLLNLRLLLDREVLHLSSARESAIPLTESAKTRVGRAGEEIGPVHTNSE